MTRDRRHKHNGYQTMTVGWAGSEIDDTKGKTGVCDYEWNRGQSSIPEW